MSDYIVNVCGDSSNATWLIKGEKNILYEAGMAYSADKMIENIKRELDGQKLDAVMLSHSHYDHVAGLPFVKKEWPDVTVYGSTYAAKILEKPTVRATMRRLSTVNEGDVLEIGDHRIEVFETPGHTKCSVSYLVDEDVLMASETIGVFKGGWYMPCYLVGYRMCLDAVEKLRKLPAKRLFISHMGVQSGADLDELWAFIKKKLEKTKEEILEIIQTYDSEEKRMQIMKERYHDNVVSESEQPSFAFLLNAAATLKVIENECMEGKE